MKKILLYLIIPTTVILIIIIIALVIFIVLKSAARVKRHASEKVTLKAAKLSRMKPCLHKKRVRQG